MPSLYRKSPRFILPCLLLIIWNCFLWSHMYGLQLHMYPVLVCFLIDDNMLYRHFSAHFLFMQCFVYMCEWSALFSLYFYLVINKVTIQKKTLATWKLDHSNLPESSAPVTTDEKAFVFCICFYYSKMKNTMKQALNQHINGSFIWNLELNY